MVALDSTCIVFFMHILRVYVDIKFTFGGMRYAMIVQSVIHELSDIIIFYFAVKASVVSNRSGVCVKHSLFPSQGESGAFSFDNE